MNIQENISLKPYNSFGIDKNARFFVVVKTTSELIEALKWGSDRNLEIFILGGGSNILLTRDLEALIIKIELEGINADWETNEHVWVEAGAGESWHNLVLFAIEHNWGGIENLSLIPGTVGASPMQNIGAYGVELEDAFYSLKALNRSTWEIEKFDNQQCQFGYRESIFKNELKNQYIILYVTFKLDKNPAFNLEYGAIRETLNQNNISVPSLKSVSDAIIAIRQSKLPDPRNIGNAGSFFKNPTISKEDYQNLKIKYPNIPGYVNDQGVKVPAAWLIEQCGWKGKRFGEVGIHENQPLVLVNYGKGDGAAIKELSQNIQKSVSEKFNIELKPEVNFL